MTMTFTSGEMANELNMLGTKKEVIRKPDTFYAWASDLRAAAQVGVASPTEIVLTLDELLRMYNVEVAKREEIEEELDRRTAELDVERDIAAGMKDDLVEARLSYQRIARENERRHNLIVSMTEEREKAETSVTLCEESVALLTAKVERLSKSYEDVRAEAHQVLEVLTAAIQHGENPSTEWMNRAYILRNLLTPVARDRIADKPWLDDVVPHNVTVRRVQKAVAAAEVMSAREALTRCLPVEPHTRDVAPHARTGEAQSVSVKEALTRDAEGGTLKPDIAEHIAKEILERLPSDRAAARELFGNV